MNDERPFFFNLASELMNIAESDLRLNILTSNDGECENLKITGVDKDGKNPVIRVEDEEGDEFFIFIAHILSINPVEKAEEDDSATAEEDDDSGAAAQNT